MLSAELRTVHTNVIQRKLGEMRVRRHRTLERVRKRWRWDEENPMPPCTLPYQHTYTQTLPLLCSNNGSTATQKCTWKGSEGKQRKITPQSQARRWVNKKTIEIYKEKEESTLLCLEVCEALKKKIKQTGTEREFEEQTHTSTTLVLPLSKFCMMANHVYQTKSKAFPSASESFLLKQTND